MVITPVIAEELLGVLTKIEDGGKKLTVESKEDGKEVTVTTNGDTEYRHQEGERQVRERCGKDLEGSVEGQGRGEERHSRQGDAREGSRLEDPGHIQEEGRELRAEDGSGIVQRGAGHG